MCRPFSCIVTKGKKVLICDNPHVHNHEVIIKQHNLKDDLLVNRSWIRIEVYPTSLSYYIADVDTWTFDVDEWDTLPDWFTLNKEVYENLCRKAAKKWKKTFVDEFGQYMIEDNRGNRDWYLNGEFHRLDGPAREWAIIGDREWYQNGLRHREDGPAVEYKDGGKEWWLNGKRHRKDGPAIDYYAGERRYWENGKRIPKPFSSVV